MVAMFSTWRSRSTRVVSTALLTQWRRDVLSRCTYTMDNGGGFGGGFEVVGVVGVVGVIGVVEVAVVVEVVEVVGVIIDDADTIESTAAPPTTFLFVVLRTPQSKDSLCNKFSTFSKTCWEVGLLSGSAVIHMVNNSIKRSLY